jgi:hypothetical protein
VQAARVGIGAGDLVRQPSELGITRHSRDGASGEAMAPSVATGACLAIPGAWTGAAMGVAPVGLTSAGRGP